MGAHDYRVAGHHTNSFRTIKNVSFAHRILQGFTPFIFRPLWVAATFCHLPAKTYAVFKRTYQFRRSINPTNLSSHSYLLPEDD